VTLEPSQSPRMLRPLVSRLWNAESRVTLMLALNPLHWRAGDKASWAMSLIAAVEAAAPDLLRVEGYEIRDTLVYVRTRTNQTPARMRKLLREDDAMMRVRARLADLGARPDFEVERD
jgi:hypothetical protein